MKNFLVFLSFLTLLLLFSCSKKEPTVIRENAYYRETVTEMPDGLSFKMDTSLSWDGERLHAEV